VQINRVAQGLNRNPEREKIRRMAGPLNMILKMRRMMKSLFYGISHPSRRFTRSGTTADREKIFRLFQSRIGHDDNTVRQNGYHGDLYYAFRGDFVDPRASVPADKHPISIVSIGTKNVKNFVSKHAVSFYNSGAFARNEGPTDGDFEEDGDSGDDDSERTVDVLAQLTRDVFL
jgi:hypothetical protein